MNSNAPSFADRCAALLNQRPDLFVEPASPPRTVQTGWWVAAPHVEQRRRSRTRQMKLKLAA